MLDYPICCTAEFAFVEKKAVNGFGLTTCGEFMGIIGLHSVFSAKTLETAPATAIDFLNKVILFELK